MSKQENKDRLLVIMAVLCFGGLEVSEFILKERSSMCSIEGVSAVWEQGKKRKCCLVFFWSSIISLLANQRICNSLPDFWKQFILFTNLLQCKRVSRGCPYKIVQKGQKFLSSLWKNQTHMPTSLWARLHKGSWSKYVANFCGVSCAGIQTEILIWSILILFLAWSAGLWVLIFILLLILNSSALQMNFK